MFSKRLVQSSMNFSLLLKWSSLKYMNKIERKIKCAELNVLILYINKAAQTVCNCFQKWRSQLGETGKQNSEEKCDYWFNSVQSSKFRCLERKNAKVTDFLV